MAAQAAHAGAQQTTFFATVPDGVRCSWASATERGYFEGVRDPASSGAVDRQVETARKTVQSGLKFEVIGARLPGDAFRMDGRLEISAFTGSSLDRAVVSFPIQIDAYRRRWVRTVVIHGGDVGADAAFRHFGFNLSGSGDAIELLVRVE